MVKKHNHMLCIDRYITGRPQVRNPVGKDRSLLGSVTTEAARVTLNSVERTPFHA